MSKVLKEVKTKSNKLKSNSLYLFITVSPSKEAPYPPLLGYDNWSSA